MKRWRTHMMENTEEVEREEPKGAVVADDREH